VLYEIIEDDNTLAMIGDALNPTTDGFADGPSDYTDRRPTFIDFDNCQLVEDKADGVGFAIFLHELYESASVIYGNRNKMEFTQAKSMGHDIGNSKAAASLGSYSFFGYKKDLTNDKHITVSIIDKEKDGLHASFIEVFLTEKKEIKSIEVKDKKKAPENLRGEILIQYPKHHEIPKE
jgi:hypothetical protein